MKLLIVFALISTLAASAYSQDLSCAELEKNGEAGIRKMFIMEEGATIPKTEAELDTRCNEGKKLYKSMLEYKKCLKPFPQQIFSTTTQSVGKLLKKNCADPEGKKVALKLLQCATPEKIKEGQQCAIGSLDAIQKLSETVKDKGEMISKTCCLAHVAADCARTKLSTLKCEDPTVNVSEHFEQTMEALTKESLEIACDQYKTLAICQAKIPEAVAELKEIISKAPTTFGNRSLIKPLLEVAEKIAN